MGLGAASGRRGKPVNLRQARYVVAVWEEGSFTRAAMRCGVSQPSISIAIQRLESELGVALFSRGPRGRPVPTAFLRKIGPRLSEIGRLAEHIVLMAAKLERFSPRSTRRRKLPSFHNGVEPEKRRGHGRVD
jgi:DNA-binding transcriptional LysR family regulator